MPQDLKEQIERLKQLNERLTEMQVEIIATNEAVASTLRVKPRGPLLDVRDCRTYESHPYHPSEPPPAVAVGRVKGAGPKATSKRRGR